MEYQKKTRYFLVSCFVVILFLIFFEQNIIQKLCLTESNKQIERDNDHIKCPKCPTCDKTAPNCPTRDIESMLLKTRYFTATPDDLYSMCPNLDRKTFVRKDALIHIDDDYSELNTKYSHLLSGTPTQKDYENFCAPYTYTRLKFDVLNVNLPACVWSAAVDNIVSASVIAGDFWDYNVATSMLTQVMGRDSPGIVIDGGVNIGEFTILSAYLGQTVIGFEPLPDHINMVKKSLFLNRLQQNVILVRNALSYTSDTQTLVIGSTNKGSSYVVDSKGGGNTVDIDVVTFDMVIEKLKGLHRLPENFNVRYLKVDIEGFEPYFAMGAEKFWFNHNIEGMAFELTYDRFNQLKCNATLFNIFFQKLGYNVYYTKGESNRNYYFNEKNTGHFYDMMRDRTLLDVFMIKKAPLA